MYNITTNGLTLTIAFPDGSTSTTAAEFLARSCRRNAAGVELVDIINKRTNDIVVDGAAAAQITLDGAVFSTASSAVAALNAVIGAAFRGAGGTANQPDMSNYYDKTAVDSMMSTEQTTRQQNDVTLQTAIGNEAATRINADTALQNAINGKADISHTHTIANVTALQNELNSRYTKTEVDDALGLKVNSPAPSGSSMSGKIPTLNANGDGLNNSGKEISDFAAANHTHTKSDITDFPTAMPPTAHSHGTADITGILTIAQGGTGNDVGNATTATKLATARTIAIGGKVSGAATAFDGSANIIINATAVSDAAKWTTARALGCSPVNLAYDGTAMLGTNVDGSANVTNIPVNGVTGILNYTHGGTGLDALGTANQIIKVNSRGSALEFGDIPGVTQVDSVTYSGSQDRLRKWVYLWKVGRVVTGFMRICQGSSGTARVPTQGTAYAMPAITNADYFPIFQVTIGGTYACFVSSSATPWYDDDGYPPVFQGIINTDGTTSIVKTSPGTFTWGDNNRMIELHFSYMTAQ